MAKLETERPLDQIVERMGQLTDEDKRALASVVLSDPGLEPFIEELDDSLTCERAVDEGLPKPFRSHEVNRRFPE